ncbi:hypothetical protein BDQ17DRAFT_1425774 [Cyathus striatus]|nr:hypothetical protein BDQ17DRAFT_1425774 [Cyathus striatus]
MPLYVSSNALNFKLWQRHSGVLRSSPHLVVRRTSQMISPFDKLPTELIQDIFDRCIDWEGSRDLRHVPPPRQWTTIRISQVCQRWRYITLDMPHLWTCIYMSNANFVQLCLQRSKNRPLYIMTARGTNGTRPTKVSGDVISYAIDHIMRWKAVRIVLDRCNPDDLSGLRGKSTPLLESLNVDGMGFPLERRLPLTDVIFSLLSSSSQTRHLFLSHLCLPSSLDVKVLSRLTSIALCDLQTLTSDDCIKCLSMCTSATEIIFTSTAVDLLPPSKTHPVTLLPRLAKLDLSIRSDAAKFLQYFSLPHLKELYIGRNQGPHDYDALDRFYVQSKFSLESFRFMLDDRSMENIVLLFQLPWLNRIPHVSLICFGVSERTKSRLLLRPEISHIVKEKLTVDGDLIGWGKHI